jgi:hypothetical protein
MQTSIPSPYTGMVDGLRKITASEGIGGLYKGLYPLWGRQIPYTMVSDNWHGVLILVSRWKSRLAPWPIDSGRKLPKG